MKNKHILFGMGFSLLVVSCGSDSTTDELVVDENLTEQNCRYSYNPDETTLTWTAFKLTERIGVNGTFDDIQVTANNSATDVFGVLNGATFQILTASLNSHDVTRDPKIKESFFGSLKETESISGTVKSIDAAYGTVEITMNGVTKEYQGTVRLREEEITLSLTINMADFNGGDAIEELNKVCEDLHKGSDGISVLWDDIDIVVKSVIAKECN